jgi:hypothetical protein
MTTNMDKDFKSGSYGQTLGLVEYNGGIEWPVTEYLNEVQRMVAKGVVFFSACLRSAPDLTGL